MSEARLPAGLYEAVVTSRLERMLGQLGEATVTPAREFEAADADLVVAHHLVPLIRRAIAGQPTDQRVAKAVSIANDLVGVLHTHGPHAVDADDEITDFAQVLLAITPAPALPGQQIAIPRPTTPLSESDLLTNANGEPTIGNEIALELESADHVDVICAFIRWSGIRQLFEPIRRLTAAGTPVRFVTTTYLGATERRALDGLVEVGAEVKVSYETRTPGSTPRRGSSAATPATPRRTSGRRTSRVTALLDGLEWNVRLSAVEQPRAARHVPGDLRRRTGSPARSRRTTRPRSRAVRRRDREGPWRRRPDAGDTARDHQPRRPPVPLPARDPRRARGRAERARPAAQPGRDGDRHRQDRRRRARLPRACAQRGPVDVPAVRRAPRRSSARAGRSFRHVLRDGTFGETLRRRRATERWRHVFASIQSLAALGAETIDPRRASTW